MASVGRVAAAAQPKALRCGAAMACAAQKKAIQDVTKSTWQALILNSDRPVLVMFWASWCGNCRRFNPCMYRLAEYYEGQMKFYKLNTNKNQNIVNQFGLRILPTMMMFKDGKEKARVIGLLPEKKTGVTLIRCIENLLGNAEP